MIMEFHFQLGVGVDEVGIKEEGSGEEKVEGWKWNGGGFKEKLIR